MFNLSTYCNLASAHVHLSSAKYIGAGLATISISGTGVGIGVIFGSLLISVSRNQDMSDKLFSYAILGFALTEAIALFGLMVVVLLLFGV
jgi:F-type H+-transporting ATPase subunit c